MMNKMTIAMMLSLVAGIGVISTVNAGSEAPLYLVAYEHCNKVLEVELNESQTKAYQALKTHEAKFELAHKPLERLEAVIEKHHEALSQSHEPHAITAKELAHIEAVAAKIEKVAAEMVNVEQVASEFEKVAKAFEVQIKPLLGDNEYQQVQIVEKEKLPTVECYASRHVE
jgi:hypothetical protein